MPEEISIRALEREDLDALLSLYRHLHAQDDAPPARSVLERIWAQILGDPSHIYLGAFVSEGLVSACNACVVPNLTRGGRPYAVMMSGASRAEVHGFYEALGFDRRAKQAFVINAPV